DGRGRSCRGPYRDLQPVHHAPPSSTISPSTTSPSPPPADSPGLAVDPASAPPADPPPGAAACCEYMAWPIRWNAWVSVSVVDLIRSTSSPFRASFSSSFAFCTASRSSEGTLSPYSDSALSTW